jgi:DNA-binding protein WhiA
MCSLEIMNIKIYKNMRNKANRVTNCETANISKTVNASIAQLEAIRRLKREHGFDILPEELREVAQLRVDNPDMSLRELGRLLSTPLTRSGVNHRLMKIMELAGGHDSAGNTDANSLKFSKR